MRWVGRRRTDWCDDEVMRGELRDPQRSATALSARHGRRVSGAAIQLEPPYRCRSLLSSLRSAPPCGSAGLQPDVRFWSCPKSQTRSVHPSICPSVCLSVRPTVRLLAEEVKRGCMLPPLHVTPSPCHPTPPPSALDSNT